MWSFFHGWRRKAGIVALVMACAVITLWARSIRWEEDIRCRIGAFEVVGICCRSSWIELYWMNELGNPAESADHLLEPDQNFAWYSFVANPKVDQTRTGKKVWHHSIATGELAAKTFNVPYWLLALAPTLLSAHLVLWPQCHPTVMQKAVEAPR